MRTIQQHFRVQKYEPNDVVFFFQAEDGIRDGHVTGVQTCALPISNLNVCLMAVKAGSTDCNDAFPVMKSFFEKAGVDTSQVALADGRGGNPSDRFTPQAATEMLRRSEERRVGKECGSRWGRAEAET